jgi:hypothetical protein
MQYCIDKRVNTLLHKAVSRQRTCKLSIMQKLCFFICLEITGLMVSAQMDSLTKTRFVIGISAPELLHAGVNMDMGKTNQVGVSAGIGPSWGTVWPTLNIEHRLYIGKLIEETGRKRWFLKQGATYFTAAENQSAFSFSVGADLKSKARNNGWTIDLGGFILFQSDRGRKNQFFPALRFQHYNYFKKNKKQ